MIIFEFFSGIGGMHQATEGLPDFKIKKIFPFDINPNANITYLHNFGVKPFEISIESFSLEDYEKLCAIEEVDRNLIWTMSPPCQPFSRQGKEKDLTDFRTKGFLHLMSILEKTNIKFLPKYFLLENVKNFEHSDACAILKKTLFNRNYKITQFLLSPNQVGVPNSRPRYYLLARDSNEKDFIVLDDLINENGVITSSEILYKLNLINYDQTQNLKDYLNYDLDEEVNKKEFLLDEKIFAKESSNTIHIITVDTNHTCCFTKGYGKLLKGSGSILLIDQSLYKVKYFINKLKIGKYGSNRFNRQITIFYS